MSGQIESNRVLWQKSQIKRERERKSVTFRTSSRWILFCILEPLGDPVLTSLSVSRNIVQNLRVADRILEALAAQLRPKSLRHDHDVSQLRQLFLTSHYFLC
jgi:hypothetical protein